MHQSELVHLFSLLDKAEIRRAERFINSTYHNNNQTATKLFKYLRRYHPDMNSFKLGKEHAYAHLYPREPYNDRRMRNQMSSLKKLMEDFLMLEQLQKEEATRNRLLMNACYPKFSYDKFAGLVENRIKELKKQQIKDTEYYLEMLWLQEELYYHPNKSKYLADENYITQLMHNLDQFFALSKFRFDTDQKVRDEVINESNLLLLDIKLLTQNTKKLNSSNELIRFYYELYQIHQESNPPEDFQATIDRLIGLLPSMGEKEKSYTMSCLINIGVYYSNQGHQIFTEYVAQLFALADVEGLILYRGKLQASSFLNAVLLCSAAGKFDWAEKFIKKYGPYLAPAEKEYTLNLALGYWYFLRSKGHTEKISYLQKAHACLSKIPYSGLEIDLRLRSLQLRVYYELELMYGNDELFFHFAEAFEKWLTRHTVLAEERNISYLNFVRLAKQLARVYKSNNTDSKKLQQVKTKISKQEPIILKNWLLAKVEELDQLLHH